MEINILLLLLLQNPSYGNDQQSIFSSLSRCTSYHKNISSSDTTYIAMSKIDTYSYAPHLEPSFVEELNLCQRAGAENIINESHK